MTKNSLQTKIKGFKPSGVDWLGNIPVGWDIVPTRSLFKTKKQVVGSNAEKHLLLGLTLGGVKPRDLSLGGKNPADYDNYQIFEPGELVMCLFDYDVTPRTVGYVKQKGMMTGAYTRLIPRAKLEPRYYYYLFLYFDEKKELLHLCTGLRNSISKHVFWSLQNPLPPLETQKRIADFLDEKTEVIDELIAKKEKLLELLREKRAALITRAVTKGLDPDAKLKPSGVDWLGNIPVGWRLKRNRFLGTYQKGKTADICASDEKDCLPYLSAEVIRGFQEPDFCRGPVIAKEKQILLLWDGANAGEFFWAGPGVVSSTFSLILPQQTIIPEFYYWILKGFERLLRDYTQGMGIPHVSPWVFKDSFLPEVPIEEQKQIANFLNAETAKIDKAVLLIESQIEKLKESRSSLIYHAVTGKIKI